jgi:hypothetical protein
MLIEQVGINKLKITLETDLEKETIGKSESIEVSIVETNTISFRSQPSVRNETITKA